MENIYKEDGLIIKNEIAMMTELHRKAIIAYYRANYDHLKSADEEDIINEYEMRAQELGDERGFHDDDILAWVDLCFDTCSTLIETI